MVPLRNRFFQSSSLHLYAILIRSRGEQVWHTSLRMSSTWCKNYGTETMIGFSIVEKSRLLGFLPMSILFRRVMPKKWSGMNWTICWGKWRKSVTLRTRKWYEPNTTIVFFKWLYSRRNSLRWCELFVRRKIQKRKQSPFAKKLRAIMKENLEFKLIWSINGNWTTLSHWKKDVIKKLLIIVSIEEMREMYPHLTSLLTWVVIREQ